MYWLCLSMASWLVDNEVDIVDWEELFTILSDIDDQLSVASRVAHGEDLSVYEFEKQNSEKSGLPFSSEEPPPSNYYFTWQVGPTNSNFRTLRFNEVFKILKERQDYRSLIERSKLQVA